MASVPPCSTLPVDLRAVPEPRDGISMRSPPNFCSRGLEIRWEGGDRSRCRLRQARMAWHVHRRWLAPRFMKHFHRGPDGLGRGVCRGHMAIRRPDSRRAHFGLRFTPWNRTDECSGIRPDPCGATCVRVDGSSRPDVSMSRDQPPRLPVLRTGHPRYRSRVALTWPDATPEPVAFGVHGEAESAEPFKPRCDHRPLGPAACSGSSHPSVFRQVPPRRLAQRSGHARRCLVCRRGKLPGAGDGGLILCTFVPRVVNRSLHRHLPMRVRVTGRT